LQEEEKEKKRKAQEESKMDAEALRQHRESEAHAQQHETAKTAHYAKLGAAFAKGTIRIVCLITLRRISHALSHCRWLVDGFLYESIGWVPQYWQQ
jgi:hypothetical protein